MGKIIMISFVIALFISCANNAENKLKEPCVLDIWYRRRDTPGPNGLMSIVLINDRDLRNMLLSIKPPLHLSFKYSGSIYNIDSLSFITPVFNIRNINDSIIGLGQGVWGLGQYTDSFLDSIVEQTKRDIVIEITDTIGGKKWTIPNCN
jgi:hypothetical protein